MKYVMLWICLCLGIGILWAQGVGSSWAPWIAWAVALTGLVVAMLVRSRPARRVLLFGSVVAVGILRAYLGLAPSERLSLLGPNLHELSVRVVSYPSLGEKRIRFTAQPDGLPGRLLVTIYTEETQGGLVHFGDRLVVSGSVRIPAPIGEFDYAAYLKRQGIFATMTAQESEVLHLESGSGSILRLGDVLRQRFLERLRRDLSHNPFAVGQSLLFGDRFALDPGVEAAFSRTGMMHLLAVSGLHLGVLLAGLWFGLRRLGLRPAVAYPVVGVAVLLVLWFVGPRVSLLRASLLFLFLACGTVLADVGLVLRRSVHPLNGLGVAGVVLLLARPGSLFDAGFQLTFAATASILAFGSLAGVGPTIERLSKRFPRPLASVARAALSLAWVSAAAQAGAAPVIAVQFGAVHPWSVMTSVFVVPVAAGSLWLGLLAILLGPVRWLGYAVARLFEWGLNALVAMVGALAEAPTVEMKVDAATGLWIAACVVFLYFAAGSSSGRDSWTLNSTSIAPPRESSRRGSCRPVRAKEAT